MKISTAFTALLLQLVAAVPDRVHAQCEPVTSYVPITFTVTVTQSPVTSTSSTATLLPQISTSTSTSTIHLSEVTSPVSAASASPTQTTYSFVVESGLTSWYGNAPSSGLSLTTITTTIYVFPSTTITVLPTTTVSPVTIEPPAYSFTSYSLIEPVSTSTITTTRTTTTVITNTITVSRSAFTSPKSGWNNTSGDSGSNGVYGSSTQSMDGIPTTVTGTVYWSIGTQITSTSLTTLTLTLTRSRTLTSTISPQTNITTVAGMTSTSSGLETATASASSSVLLTDQSTSALSSTSATTSATNSDNIVAASYDSVAASSVGAGLTSSGSGSVGQQPQSSVSSLSSIASESASYSALATPSVEASGATYTTLQTYSSSGQLQVSSAAKASSADETSLATDLSTPSTSVALTSTSYSSSSLTSSTQTLASSNTSADASTRSLPTISPSQSLPIPGPTESAKTSSSAYSDQSSEAGHTSASDSTVSPIRPSTTSSIESSILPSSQTQYGQLSSSLDSLTSVASSAAGTYLASVVPIATSSSATSTIVSGSPIPSVCGEHGNFTLDFDDLPSFMPNQTIDITQAPPIFNGYHHLAFSNGYVYAPPPKDPFPPVSPPHLAVFLGNASGNGTGNTPTAMAPVSGLIRPGEFGDGSSDSVSAFWFDGYSTWIGCDNSGPEPCTYVMTAFAWNPTTLKEEQIDTQNLTTSGCPDFQNCHLEQVSFPPTFKGLSGLQIQAYKGPDQVMFFMDDVHLGWYNNTCAAGLQRLRSQRSGPMRRSPRLHK